MKKEERLGVEFTTNEECQVIVIDYVNANKIQVMFLDEHKHKMWTSWVNLKRGNLKNPFHKSVYGVGYLGTDENGQMPKTVINGKKTKEYQTWFSMMTRCYNEKYHERQPTYKNCTVCIRWCCYSLFLQDLPFIKNYALWRDNDDYELNKDTYYTELGIKTDCKEYSLETARFIPKQENQQEKQDRVGSGYPKQRIVAINITTGEKVEFESIRECARTLNLDFGATRRTLIGEQKQHKGYKFELID